MLRIIFSQTFINGKKKKSLRVEYTNESETEML